MTVSDSRSTREASLIQQYRLGRLTQYELARALGISRLQTEAILKAYNVTEDLPRDEDIRQDVETLQRLLDR